MEQGEDNVTGLQRLPMWGKVHSVHSEHRETQKPPNMAGLSRVCKGRLYLEQSGGGRRKRMVGLSASFSFNLFPTGQDTHWGGASMQTNTWLLIANLGHQIFVVWHSIKAWKRKGK